jgi:uncharacterized short protein YbdD (DUF466 family)
VNALRRVWWYVREVMGETAYDTYVAHHRRTHPGEPTLTRHQFDDVRANPNIRCC